MYVSMLKSVVYEVLSINSYDVQVVQVVLVIIIVRVIVICSIYKEEHRSKTHGQARKMWKTVSITIFRHEFAINLHCLHNTSPSITLLNGFFDVFSNALHRESH